MIEYLQRRLPRVWSSFCMVKVAVLDILVSSVIVTLKKNKIYIYMMYVAVLFHPIGEDEELEAIRSVHRSSLDHQTLEDPKYIEFSTLYQSYFLLVRV